MLESQDYEEGQPSGFAQEQQKKSNCFGYNKLSKRGKLKVNVS